MGVGEDDPVGGDDETRPLTARLAHRGSIFAVVLRRWRTASRILPTRRTRHAGQAEATEELEPRIVRRHATPAQRHPLALGGDIDHGWPVLLHQ
jgi:hypothetical protein